jgi:hypothetical protein
VGPNGANANAQQNQNFNGINQNPFFANPEVRSQLRMNNRQFDQLNSAYQRAFQRYDRSLRGLGTGSAAAQRQQRLQNDGTNNVGTGSAAAQRAQRLSNAGANNRGLDVANRDRRTTETNAAPAIPGVETTVPNPAGNNPIGAADATRADDTQSPTGANPGTSPIDQQRLAQQQLLEDQFRNDFNSSLETTFTDPAMRQRFNQLNTQFQGIGAFNDPMIQRQLNLTAQQRQQLATLSGQWRRDMMNLQRSSRNNLTQEQFNALRTRYATRLNTVLTPEQQQMWTQMLGEPFDFPFTDFFPQSNPRTISNSFEPQAVQATGDRSVAPQNRAAQSPQTPAVR